MKEQQLGILQLIDALSACCLSAKTDQGYRQWAGIQLVRSLASHVSGQDGSRGQLDLGADLPPCSVSKLEGHQNRLGDCMWSDKKNLLATR